jgi:hypothetical protein
MSESSYDSYGRRRYCGASECESYYESSYDSDGEADERASRPDGYWPYSALGASTDVLVPKNADVQKISELLGRVKAPQGARCFADAGSMLPGLPGLRVKGVGDVSLPLRQENVGPLEAVGQLVRNNVWLLPPANVEMRNPEWQKGIQKLSQAAAASLGFKDVKLLPVFIMLLAYGPGGRLEKQQIKDPAGRCVATLEVQLPSVYTGGDLIVDDGEPRKSFRVDFGRKAGDAEFRPHYGVYAVGAYRTVEEVTSGYRLMALYSLCLPEELPSFSGNSAINLLRVQLAETIKKVTTLQGGVKAEGALRAASTATSGDSVILALMLSQLIKEQHIKTYGSAALSGMDRDRFDALVAANALLTSGKQLNLYFACLRHTFVSSWDTNPACERVSWYSLKGAKLGDSPSASMDWSSEFKFLNPGKETFGELWNDSGVSGYSEHARFAIVGWPVSANIMNTFSWMGEDAATTAVLADNPIQPAKLLQLLSCKAHRQSKAKELAKTRYSAYGYGGAYGYSPSTPQPKLVEPPLALTVCRSICKAITASVEVNLVDMFFKTCFSQVKEKAQMTMPIAALIRVFRWAIVRVSIESAIQDLPRAEGMGFALMLATALKDYPLAQSALTQLAARIARLWGGDNLRCLPLQDVEALWRNAAACDRPEILRDVGKVFTEINGKHLQSVIGALSKSVTVSSPEEHRSVFTSIVSRRREWLEAEIADIVKPFTCQILDSSFPNAAELIAFFKGPNRSCVIRGFTSIAEARKRVDALQTRIRASLQMTSEGRGRDSLVRIIKTSGAFDPRKELLPGYKAEIVQLIQLTSRLLPSSCRISTAFNPTKPFGGLSLVPESTLKKSNTLQDKAALPVRNIGLVGGTSASATTTTPCSVVLRAGANASSPNICGDSSVASRSLVQQTDHGSSLLNAGAESPRRTDQLANIPLSGSKNMTTNSSSGRSHGNVQPADYTKKRFDGEASALPDACHPERGTQPVAESIKRVEACGGDTTASTSSGQHSVSTPVKERASEDSTDAAFASVRERPADLGHVEKGICGEGSDATRDDPPSAAGNASPKTVTEMASPVSVGRLSSDCSPVAATSRGGAYGSDHLAILGRLLGDVLSMDPAMNDENTSSNAHASRASATIGKKRLRDEESDVAG